MADLADVGMELPPEVSSAPAEAASFSERSAPEFVQEDVEIEVERRQTIPMIDVCLCSERVRVGCLTSPDLLFAVLQEAQHQGHFLQVGSEQ